MATVPVPWTMGANGVIPSTSYNTGARDPLTFLLNPPLAILRQSVAQTFTSGSWAAVTFDVEDLDTVNGHSTSSNTDRYTAVYAGWYHVDAYVAFASNGSGARGARLGINGSTTLSVGRATFLAAVVTDRAAIPVSGTVFLSVGDYVNVAGFQSSGGNLNSEVGVADLRSVMMVRWVSN